MSPVRLGPVMNESMLGSRPACRCLASSSASPTVATSWSIVASTTWACGRIESPLPPQVKLDTRIEPVWATSDSQAVSPASQPSRACLSQAAVPPSDLRPSAPVIRARPAPEPMPVPAMNDEDDADVFAPAPHAAVPAQPHAEAPKDRSFAALFGWSKRPAEEQPVARAAPVDEGFDDELEIPAFLRRSGNA